MTGPRHLLAYPPTASGPGTGSSFFMLWGYDCISPRDRLMRLRELPSLGDDVASLRAAGYAVVCDLAATRETLRQALLCEHPAAAGARAAGVLWNGHGRADGSLGTSDGGHVGPDDVPPEVAGLATVRLFILAACRAGGAAERWGRALGSNAHVFGWDTPINVTQGIDFFTPDAGAHEELDDLLRDRLGVRNLGPGPHAETNDLLELDWEHAVYYRTNPLAPSASELPVGAEVLAQWRNGTYYPALLDARDGRRWRARWHDGSEPTWVQAYQLRPLGAPTQMTIPVLAPGARVRVRWSNGRFYRGTVDSLEAGRALVRWKDGSSPTWAALADVVYHEERAQHGAGCWSLGDRALARWKDGWFYPGKLQEHDGARYLVVWEDGGEPRWVAPDGIAPVDETCQG